MIYGVRFGVDVAVGAIGPFYGEHSRDLRLDERYMIAGERAKRGFDGELCVGHRGFAQAIDNPLRQWRAFKKHTASRGIQDPDHIHVDDGPYPRSLFGREVYDVPFASEKPLLLSAEEDKTQVVSAGRSDGAPGVSGVRRYVATFILYPFALQTQR
jgi:hypothetical protein